MMVMLLVVIVVFVLIIFFYILLVLVDYLVGSFFCCLSFVEGVVYNMVMYFFLLNSVLNSVIYGFMDKRFKRRFLLLFKR